jgi:hypothetical protein
MIVQLARLPVSWSLAGGRARATFAGTRRDDTDTPPPTFNAKTT